MITSVSSLVCEVFLLYPCKAYRRLRRSQRRLVSTWSAGPSAEISTAGSAASSPFAAAIGSVSLRISDAATCSAVSSLSAAAIGSVPLRISAAAADPVVSRSLSVSARSGNGYLRKRTAEGAPSEALGQGEREWGIFLCQGSAGYLHPCPRRKGAASGPGRTPDRQSPGPGR